MFIIKMKIIYSYHDIVKRIHHIINSDHKLCKCNSILKNNCQNSLLKLVLRSISSCKLYESYWICDRKERRVFFIDRHYDWTLIKNIFILMSNTIAETIDADNSENTSHENTNSNEAKEQHKY